MNPLNPNLSPGSPRPVIFPAVLPPETTPPDALANLVLAAVRDLDLACPAACAGEHCEHLCPPSMVPLLVYCYSAGVFASADIEDIVSHEPDFSIRPASPKWPTGPCIRAFRKHHFAELHRGLTVVVAAARSANIALDRRSGAGLTWDKGSPEEEAMARIQLAVYLDSMETDA